MAKKKKSDSENKAEKARKAAEKAREAAKKADDAARELENNIPASDKSDASYPSINSDGDIPPPPMGDPPPLP